MRIADLSMMTVRAQAAEADIDKLRIGMPVIITTLGGGERRWHGVIREIDPTPNTLNNVVLYDVLVDVPNADRALLPGMTAQVFFQLANRTHVMVLPREALGQRDRAADSARGNAYYVNADDNSHAVSTLVHVGLVTRTSVEIVDGLKAGDKVFVASGGANAQGGSAPGGSHYGGFGRGLMGPNS